MVVTKRDSSFLALLVFVVIAGMYGLIRFFGILPYGVSLVFLAAISAILGWVIVIPAICRDMRLQWEAGERAIDEIKSTFITQHDVYEVLSNRARLFEYLCQQEVKLQGGETAEGDLESLKQSIHEAKAQFWAAHALAKKLSFEVKPKVSDYVYGSEI